MMDVAALAEDLRVEQDSLDVVVAGLAEVRWNAPTPSPGWAVRDQIGHLTYFDGTAALAITDPDAFRASVETLLDGGDVDRETLHQDLPHTELLEAWRAN